MLWFVVPQRGGSRGCGKALRLVISDCVAMTLAREYANVRDWVSGEDLGFGTVISVSLCCLLPNLEITVFLYFLR